MAQSHKPQLCVNLELIRKRQGRRRQVLLACLNLMGRLPLGQDGYGVGGVSDRGVRGYRISISMQSWGEPMRESCKTFLFDNSGATAIEYALLASFLAIAIIGGVTALGTRLSQEFSEVSSALK